ncbi:MAG: ABC transporter permease subunit [Aigarchaeota archaeon]|nr:ABC transporter permease subunit [Aigarchaeota archaeon]MDW8021851.1 ABC transporter permease subunit [Nitrososphaerota archaeon]
MLLPLLKKEVKELLMERSILIGMVIVPLIIFPVMGGLTGVGMSFAMQEVGREVAIGVADFDQTNLTTSYLPQLMREEGIYLVKLNCQSKEECIREAEKSGIRFFLIIPRGFSGNFTRGVPGFIDAFYSFEHFSISDLTMGERISSMLTNVFRKLAEGIHGGFMDLDFFERPIIQKSAIIYLGREIAAPLEFIGSAFMTLIIGLPTVAVIIASSAASVAATSIALEKESKTLELLLTIPAKRLTILLSKLFGTFLIVLLSTISFIVGLGIYVLMLAGAAIPTQAGGQIPLTQTGFGGLLEPSPLFMPVLLSTIFLTMVMTTCIGLLVGILGGDVRSAQQLVSAITFPLLMPPLFISMFTSIENLPLSVKLMLLADPFTHLFLAIQGGFKGDLVMALSSMAVILGYTVFVLILSSWLFMGERLVTMKVTLRKRPSGSEG